MRCDLIMAVWNEAEITEQAVKSLYENSGFPYRLIIIDNASEEPTASRLRQWAETGIYGEILLLRNEQNIGWLKATNQGMHLADSDYICLINNDIIAGKNWLRNMVATLEQNATLGIANPRGNERSENKTIRDINAYAAMLAQQNAGRYTELDHASGFCMLLKQEVRQKIGLLDEIYDGGYYEDDDFSRRAQQAGYYVVQCDDALVFHLGSASFKKIAAEKQRLIERNRALHEQRWGKRLRYLILVNSPDNGWVLEQARKGHFFYVVSNRHFNPSLVDVTHSNIHFLEAPLAHLWPALYFRWQKAYLRHKHRIDRALILTPNHFE